MPHSTPRRRTALAGAVMAVALASLGGGCQRQSDATSLIASAKRYRVQGDTRAAIIELKNLLQADAKDRAAMIEAGRCRKLINKDIHRLRRTRMR